MLVRTNKLRNWIAVSLSAAAVDLVKLEERAAQIGPKPEYPVVVIGAGLGGLGSGAYLAKNGFPVTVIEQHNIPGGYATSFNRSGGSFTFEVSLHATSGGIAIFLEELGIKNKVEMVRLPDIMRVVMPDHDLILPQKDPEGLIRLLCKKFPQEEKGIRKFLDLLKGILEEAGRPFNDKSILSMIFYWFTHPIMWNLRNQTFAQILDKYVKNPKLKAILSCYWGYYLLPPSKLSGWLYTLATAGFIFGGAEYIKHRSRDLSCALMDTIEKHGGRILLKAEVKNIITKEKAVVGVRTADGNTYAARAVISNASAPATFEKMLASDVIPNKYLAKLQTYRPSLSSFIVWLGLNQELRGKIQGYHIYISDDYDPDANYEASLNADASKAAFYVTIYDNAFPGYSKPGKSSITLYMPCGYAPWKRFEADYFSGHKEAYQREKSRMTQILIERAETQVIHGLRSMIEVVDSATPLTNVRYTKNPQGAIVGYEWSMDNTFINRIKNRTPIKGLYLAGSWGNPGGGFLPLMIGARNIFKALIEDWGYKS
jgi:phytoene dehydrogenase-like protein